MHLLFAEGRGFRRTESFLTFHRSEARGTGSISASGFKDFLLKSELLQDRSPLQGRIHSHSLKIMMCLFFVLFFSYVYRIFVDLVVFNGQFLSCFPCCL